MQVEAKFLRSLRGHAVLKDADGFHYVRTKARGEKNYWRCRRFRKHKCKVQAITDGFYITQIFREHTHKVEIDLDEDD